MREEHGFVADSQAAMPIGHGSSPAPYVPPYRVRHYYFRFPLSKDSTWRAHLYEFGEREREEFAYQALSCPVLWREKRIARLCTAAGYERYVEVRKEPKPRIPKAKREPRVFVT